MTEAATVPSAKIPSTVTAPAKRNLIRRPDDVEDSKVAHVAKLWWDKHKTDVFTVWFQGMQTQPTQTIMQVMANCVPGLALHSEPQDDRFFNELIRLFILEME